MKKIVRENMSTHLVTIGWNEKVETAYRRMQDQKIRHLPVLNETGEVIGMLSDRDVQRAMISTVEHEAPVSLSDVSVEFDPEARVRDFMSWPAKSVEQSTELRLVAERMVLEKMSSLLVRNGNKIVGIVTAEDLIKVLIDLLNDPQTPLRWDLQALVHAGLPRLQNTVL